MFLHTHVFSRPLIYHGKIPLSNEYGMIHQYFDVLSARREEVLRNPFITMYPVRLQKICTLLGLPHTALFVP